MDHKKDSDGPTVRKEKNLELVTQLLDERSRTIVW